METFFSYGAQNVYYKKIGVLRCPLLLIHGFAEDSSLWNEQIDFLKNYTSLLIIDLPGSGKSGYNHLLSSVDDYAGCIYALLQHEKIPCCIMLGHSMGGYIALAFAEKYPYSLKGFGFVHSTAFADSEEKKQSRLKGIAMIGEYGSQPFVKTTTPNLFSARYKKEFPARVEGLIAHGGSFRKEALQQYYQAMMLRPDRTSILRNTPVPVLFIAGAEDVAVPLADMLKQVALPKTSFIHILQGAGHMGMWENAPRVNEFILQFIQYINNNL